MPFSKKRKKMSKKERIAQTIYRAVDEINLQFPKEMRLEKSIDTRLFGGKGVASLDSLGLVRLIVTTERNIEEEFGVIITLADERAMSRKDSPFKTIETLADYISLLLEENANG